jgi:hypothetical protein
MTTQNHNLRFDNIDVEQGELHASCSRCGREFFAAPKPNERVDAVILRVRAEYDTHKCELRSPTFYDTIWK